MGDLVRLRTPSTEPREAEPPVAEPLWRELVGESLRDARRAAALRLVDVAQRAGVSPQYLSEVERGLKDPSSEILAAVAGALGLRVVDVATRAVDVGPSLPLRGSDGGRGPLCLAV